MARRRMRQTTISIHALREEGDFFSVPVGFFKPGFLSTPSARRATLLRQRLPPHYRHFYPRPPRGGRLWKAQSNAITYKISIHALREEGDNIRRNCHDGSFDFYPRPPRGGRLTVAKKYELLGKFLSTPSARRATHKLRVQPDFYRFLSTPSARRATRCSKAPTSSQTISIHALREEGDRPEPGNLKS